MTHESQDQRNDSDRSPIIERKRDAIIDRRHMMHLVISSLPHILLVVDEARWLSSFFVPSGFPPILPMEELAPDKLLDQVIPPDMRKPLLLAFNTMQATGHTSLFEYETEIDGRHVFCEIKVSPVVDSRDVLITIDDITKLKQAQRREEKQRILAEALVDTATTLNSSLNLDEVLDRLLTNLAAVIPHDTSNIMLVEGGIGKFVRCRGYSEEAILGMELPIDSIYSFRAMAETGQPLIIPDTQADPYWQNIEGTHWIAAYAGAPIMDEGKAIGFIGLDSETPGAFSTLHETRLEAFASQAAIALKNARLFREIETRNNELDAFTHTVAHDLKSPLQALLAYLAIMGMQLEDGKAEDALETMQEMQGRVKGMAGIIDGLLRLATLRGSSAETVEPVAMEPIMQAAVSRFDPSIREHNVSIEIAPFTPPAMGYGPWIEEVWANLVSNAIKYTSPYTETPHLRMCGYLLDDTVRYEVQDNGPGISEENQKRLFQMFSRFNTEVSGHGLGLTIVQRIVNKLGGTVGADSINGAGSTFWFTLPRVPEQNSEVTA